MGRNRQHKNRAMLPALLITGGLCGLLSVPNTAARADAGRTVDVQVQDADLSTVVNLLQRQTGLNFVIQNTGQPFGKVTVGLTHAPFEMALSAIVRSANGVVQRGADGVYVIQPAGSGDGSSQSVSGASNMATGTATDAAPSAEMHWQKLTLQHAIPSELLKLMQWDKYLRVPEPFQSVQMPDSHPNITNPGTSLQTVPQYVPDVPSVPVGRGNTGGLSANQSVAYRSQDPARQANQFAGAPVTTGPGGGFNGGGFNGGGFNGGGFNGGRFGRGGFNPGNNPGGFDPNQQQFGDQGAQDNGGTAGRGGLPDGVDRIYALEQDNSLFVLATPDGFNRVRDIIKSLDIAPRQVQIKVEFVTASVTDVDAFGLNFSLVPLPGVEVSNNQGTQANLSGQPQTYVQVASGNIVVQLFNSLVRTRGKVVQAPIITTTNNVVANITVTTQIPYVTTTNVVGNSGTVSNTQQAFLNIQTGLAVRARINSDDTITLNLNPQISDTSGQPSITGGAPPTVTQSLTTLRTVRNGETMVLGGLVRKQESNSQSRIPFLADLPILGQLFRNRVTNVNNQELLIFVTPTIINEDTDGPARRRA